MARKVFKTIKDATLAIKRDNRRFPACVDILRTEFLKVKKGYTVRVSLSNTKDEIEPWLLTFKDYEIITEARAKKDPQVTVKPYKRAYPAREGTTIANVITLLSSRNGATFDEIRELCVRRNGTPWSDSSIKTLLYWDINRKGYGVEPRNEDGVTTFHLVYPKGMSEPLPHRKKGEQQ